MKNIKYLLSLLCLATVFFACEDDYDRSPGGSVSTTAPVIHPLSATEFTLIQSTDESAEHFLFRLSWDRPRFTYNNGLPAEGSNIHYAVEAGIADEDFETVYPVTTTNELFTDIYAEQLNILMSQMFGIGDVEQNIEIRIKMNYTDINGIAREEYSNPVILSVKPYIYSNPLLMQLPESTFVLGSPDGGENGSLLFNAAWTALNFETLGESASAVSYNLEIGLQGDAFAKTAVLATVAGLNAEVYSETMNSAMTALLGNPSDGTYNVEMRVKAVYGNNKEKYSNTIPLTVTPYIPGPKIVKWKATEGDWSEMAVYCWGAGEFFGGWPGKKLTADEYGWYSVTIPAGFDAHLIINNNNNGKQWDMPYPTKTAQYNVNPETGTFTDATEWSVTLSWKQPGNEWSGMAIYAWGASPASETFGGWPGKVVTPDADGWYSVTVAPGQTFGNAILNNNNGGSQFDISMPITTDTALEISGNSYTVVVHN